MIPFRGGVAGRSSALLVALLSAFGPGTVAAAETCTPTTDGPQAWARTDLQPSGSRVAGGCGPIDSDSAFDVELPAPATWVLPDPRARGDAWLVVLDDGTIVHVVARDGQAPSVTLERIASLRPGEPPEALDLGGGKLSIASALDAADRFDDPLPESRVVEASSGVLVALTGPTDAYPHGVLGDDLEASSFTLLDATGRTTTVTLGADEVFEGLSLIAADLDGDDGPEVIATVSTAETGARLVAYELDGSELARSEAIGLGFRWLHQVGVGPTGPEGETEIIVVRTPHIGGVVEAYQLEGDRLERVASRPGYSSHQLGSANLDMALLADADGNGQLDVIVPDQSMTSLRLLTRLDDGFAEFGSLEVSGRLATNIAAAADAAGRLVLAVGTLDDRLRIFR